MAAVSKKDVEAVMKIAAWSEMNKAQTEWYKDTLSKNRKLHSFEYTRKVKLDPREWDKNKLQKAIVDLVKYETKLFAASVGAMKKKVEKGGDKAQTAWEKTDGKKLFDSFYGKMTLKMDKALDELESGAGDNKGATATGKGAFAKFKALEHKKLLEKPGGDVVDVLVSLQKKCNSENDEKKLTKHMEAAVSSIKGLVEKFGGSVKSTTKTIKDINESAAKMQKDKKADEQLQAIGEQLVKLKPLSKGIITDMVKYHGELKAFHADIARREFDDRFVASAIAQFKNAHSKYGGGNAYEAKLTKVKAEYKKVTKELEKA